jgi:hypothetical protein
MTRKKNHLTIAQEDKKIPLNPPWGTFEFVRLRNSIAQQISQSKYPKYEKTRPTIT